MALGDIPIKSVGEPDGGSSKCEENEPYALMVLGDSMEPEFKEGDVIVIEPGGHVKDGSYVIAYHNDEYIFRQLRIRKDGWYLSPLNPAYVSEKLTNAEDVKGVITQKKSSGGRHNRTNYE